MGIKLLNRFLRGNCQSAIEKQSLAMLRGKTITVDTMIYMYRFAGEGSAIDGFYSMISAFQKNDITPIFIFDGKPPEEKNEVLKQRRVEKADAEKDYKELANKLKVVDDADDAAEIKAEMDVLRKRFIRVKRADVSAVKELMRLMGVFYVEAQGEADELCAKLVVKKKAYACLSEDMDMFVYGCPKVLRYLSLLNETVVVYTQKDILEILKINQEEFTQIAVLAGTDYNQNADRQCDLHQALRMFAKYRRNGENQGFFEWIEDTDAVPDYCALVNARFMFRLDNIILPQECKKRPSVRKAPMQELHAFLRGYGFLFP